MCLTIILSSIGILLLISFFAWLTWMTSSHSDDEFIVPPNQLAKHIEKLNKKEAERRLKESIKNSEDLTSHSLINEMLANYNFKPKYDEENQPRGIEWYYQYNKYKIIKFVDKNYTIDFKDESPPRIDFNYGYKTIHTISFPYRIDLKETIKRIGEFKKYYEEFNRLARGAI